MASSSLDVDAGSHEPLFDLPYQTLSRSVSAQGHGVFTGQAAEVSLHPAERGSGITFQRTDLPGSSPIQALLSFVQATPRCTVLGHEGVSVQTVEHLLAALHAYQITDVAIHVSGPEIPIFDGASTRFVQMIEEAGVLSLQGSLPILRLKAPVSWSLKDVHLIALPSDELRMSYTLHYPSSSAIGTQFYSAVITPSTFRQEIAPCRTFSVYEEIVAMIEKGLLDVRGGSVENAVIIRDNQVVNEGGLRFPDEMARHKVLDLLGDLALIGRPFVAHIIAIRSGHFSNHAFAVELFQHLQRGSE